MTDDAAPAGSRATSVVRTGPSRADACVLSLAAEQHGLVTGVQLKAAGLSRHQVHWRIRTGLLHAVYAGIFQVGPVVDARMRERAAVLVCPDAVVSDRSAAALWQLLPAVPAPEPVHITLASASRGGRRPGVQTHRRALQADEVARLDEIPVTSPARTVFDLGGAVGPRELERALAQAEREDLIRRRDLRLLLDRYPGRRGTRLLSLLVERNTPALLTRSEAEERLLRLIRSAGLPEPEMNVGLHGIEVDCLWRHAQLAVEVDGFAYHTSRHAFVRDRQRDTALAAAGIQVIRLSWDQVEHERDKTLVQLAQALARAQR